MQVNELLYFTCVGFNERSVLSNLLSQQDDAATISTLYICCRASSMSVIFISRATHRMKQSRTFFGEFFSASHFVTLFIKCAISTRTTHCGISRLTVFPVIISNSRSIYSATLPHDVNERTAAFKRAIDKSEVNCLGMSELM